MNYFNMLRDFINKCKVNKRIYTGYLNPYESVLVENEEEIKQALNAVDKFERDLDNYLKSYLPPTNIIYEETK